MDAETDVIARTGRPRTVSCMTGPWISAKQLAAAIGVSVSTINRLAADGRISHLQVGSTRRFDLETVRAELYVPATTATADPKDTPEQKGTPALGARQNCTGSARWGSKEHRTKLLGR